MGLYPQVKSTELKGMSISLKKKVHALQLNNIKSDICLVFICKHYVH